MFPRPNCEFSRQMAEGTLNPSDVKLRMAREIVTEFHNAAAAQEAEEAFVRQFSERKLPADIPDYHLVNHQYHVADGRVQSWQAVKARRDDSCSRAASPFSRRGNK